MVLFLAVPFGIVLYLSLEGAVLYTLLMSAVFLSILGLLTYFAVAGGTTRYEVSKKSLRINFGMLKKTIPYTRIAKTEILDLNVSLRLFGASLPGFYLGVFRTNIGNVHAYATKISGNFLVLTLVDGEKYVLSPEQPEDLLEAIEHKRSFYGKEDLLELAREEKKVMRLVYLQVLSVAVLYLAFLVYFVWVYVSLPQIVPLHFGFDGVPNRFGDKSELLWIAGIAGMFPLINAVLTLKFGKHERGFVILLGVIFTAVLAAFLALTFFFVAVA